MHKVTMLVIAASMIVMVLLGFNGCTEGEIQALQGTLQNIDSVSGNITVRLADGSTKTFNFADVQLETIQDAFGNASLDIGDQVTIKMNEDGEVRELGVQKAIVKGAIGGIGTDNVTIRTNRVEITLQVPSTTRIRIDGNGTSSFSDLEVGQEIIAIYDVISKNALLINVEMEGDDEDYNRENYEAVEQHMTKWVHSENGTADNNSQENWDHYMFMEHPHSPWAGNLENWDYRRFSEYRHFSWSSSDNYSEQH